MNKKLVLNPNKFGVSKSTIQRIKAEFDGIINSDQNHVKALKSLVSHELDDKIFEIFQRLRNKMDQC